MKVSLNHIKKYIDLPKELTIKQIVYDLTVRTVEVESIEDTSEKYKNIIVGKILKIKNHPNADLLKICITDIGRKEPVQIVCGGSNLYEGEYVVVSLPGAKVMWHGESEPEKIKETKVRGEKSYGMICASTEVYLEEFFPLKDEREIVDLKGIKCSPGQNISDVVCMNDIVLEIDNKSLTNRPDLWGHYGIARELSAIYNLPLKKLPEIKIDKTLPKYDVEIQAKDKCNRYVAIEIENIYEKSSPMWMQALLINGGMRPINAIVDITNYVMIALGQPLHAFDRTHVDGKKIIVRNAKKNEKLLLLDDNEIDLTEDDLVISDITSPIALAGIRGGKKDSILPDTKGILLEVANFSGATIRKTTTRFQEKTDSSIRYEKNIDTERVTLGVNMALSLIKEMFKDSRIISYNDLYLNKTKSKKIDLSQEFLYTRLGKVIKKEQVEKILNALGYKVNYNKNIYQVTPPIWRSTGDVSLKDDVMGDISRILGYDNIEKTPLNIKIEKAIIQNDVLLERRIKEYLSLRCNFTEIYTYPWIDEKYIKAAGLSTKDSIKISSPPSPSQENLRTSLVPGLLEAVSKNLRYYSSFKIYEMAQVFKQGEYHPSTKEETLPIHNKFLAGCIVDKNAKNIFYELKGILENMNEFLHIEKISFEQKEKPTWADINAYLNIISNNELIGSLCLVSVKTMNDCKIKRTNVAMFEINFDKLIPLSSRTNKYNKLPQVPLVEKDLSLIVDEKVKWKDIESLIKNKVQKIEFIEEYRGSQIPNDKKSITIRLKFGNRNETMTSEEINSKINSIIKILNKKLKIELREE